MLQCTHPRVIRIFMKHDDRAYATVPHLDWEKEGYLPYLSVLGGDDTQLTICLDCGQIPNWTPVTDEMVLSSE